MSGNYRHVIIETYIHSGGGSKHSLRARPIEGQGLSKSLRVECSSKMREKHPVGTLFKIWACAKDTDMKPHIYTSWQWDYEVITPKAAMDFIQSGKAD